MALDGLPSSLECYLDCVCYFVFHVLCSCISILLVVSASALNYPERLVSKITYYVLSGILNSMPRVGSRAVRIGPASFPGRML